MRSRWAIASGLQRFNSAGAGAGLNRADAARRSPHELEGTAPRARASPSSMILSVGYDSASRVLEVEFRRGSRIYRHFDVPEFLYQGLIAARSKGSPSRPASPTDTGPNAGRGKLN